MKKIRLFLQQQQHVNLRSVGRSSRTKFLQLDGFLESSLSFGLSILSDVMDFTANVNSTVRNPSVSLSSRTCPDQGSCRTERSHWGQKESKMLSIALTMRTSLRSSLAAPSEINSALQAKVGY